MMCSEEEEKLNSLLYIIDIDECVTITNVCAGGECRNTPGGFQCICRPGYTLDEDGMGCSGKVGKKVQSITACR